MHLLATTRHVLARHPWLYWLAVAALAAGAGSAVVGATADVDAARRSWGVEQTVLVAVADIAPGDPVAVGVEQRPLPAAMVPPAALAAVDDTATARQHVRAGEIVVDRDVAPVGGPQPLIPEGWQAVAVAEPVPTGVAVGDHVAAASGGIVLADDGVVVAQLGGDGGPAVLVAFPADAAAQVAHATTSADLSLLVLP